MSYRSPTPDELFPEKPTNNLPEKNTTASFNWGTFLAGAIVAIGIAYVRYHLLQKKEEVEN